MANPTVHGRKVDGSNRIKQVNKYWQTICLRGKWRRRALTWVGISKLTIIRVPICDRDSLGVIGAGAYFEPLIRDEAFCMCFESCDDNSTSEENDTSLLVEFLRLGDA